MYHQPALLYESIKGLRINPSGTYADLTYGGGGHSREILAALNEHGRLIAFDQDDDAIQNEILDERFLLLTENFRYFKNFLRLHKALPLDGILADLGISSYQIDTAERGFATRLDGPLDMRMARKQMLTAEMLINTYSEEKLRALFYLYGEIDNARQLAYSITTHRASPIETTSQLKEIIKPCMPRNAENKYLAQVFQAIRIEVNDELGALKAMLKQCGEVLKLGGILAIISYHSLEDRLVKNYMKTGNLEGTVQKDFYGNVISPFQVITRKPVTPSETEIIANPRSRSAKLRIAQKLDR